MGWIKEFRMRIAEWMNRFPDTCWHDLVCWAVYPENHQFIEIFSQRGSAGQCVASGCTPYCGKCEEAR